jgi:hypothetical protein
MKSKYLGCWIVIVAFVVVILVIVAANAQEGHTHEGVVGRFYSTWMMPNAPSISCCSKEDCEPAASKFENGHWSARRSDDEEWIDIPAGTIEQNRDSPDGRSHLCGRKLVGQFTVFCFVRGNGA